jgi:hypothetical protein
MYYPDLATECQLGQSLHVRAIGWLERGQECKRGSIPSNFFDALAKQLESAWQPVSACGSHYCDLCDSPTYPAHTAAGSRNLFIPTDTHLFIAPELVLHYITHHQYQPPQQFIDAVISCPAQESPAYFKLMREHSLGMYQFPD